MSAAVEIKGNNTLAGKAELSPQATVASGAWAYRALQVVSADEAGRRAGRALASVSSAVRAGGGFVGHIKAYVSFNGGGSLGLSVVKADVNYKTEGFEPEEPAGSFKIAATAIVYGCPQEELTKLLEAALVSAYPETQFVPENSGAKNLKPIIPFKGEGSSENLSTAGA